MNSIHANEMASDKGRVLSRDKVRELDRRAIEDFGMPGIILMENADRGVVDYIVLSCSRKNSDLLWQRE